MALIQEMGSERLAGGSDTDDLLLKSFMAKREIPQRPGQLQRVLFVGVSARRPLFWAKLARRLCRLPRIDARVHIEGKLPRRPTFLLGLANGRARVRRTQGYRVMAKREIFRANVNFELAISRSELVNACWGGLHIFRKLRALAISE